jgi:hypothetical protein
MDMLDKKVLVSLAVYVSVSAVVVALAYSWGISAQDILARAVAVILYGVLVLAFLLRFALIILGVLAVYRILLEMHNRQAAV